MTNAQVMKAFANREDAASKTVSSVHLEDQGVTLFFSYSTCVAVALGADSPVAFTAEKFSVTTTKQMNQLRAILQREGEQVSTMDADDFRTWTAEYRAEVPA